MRWGPGPHRERRAHPRPGDDRAFIRDCACFVWLIILVFATAAVR